jgi:TrmH family RNA methyltransferase
MKTRPPRRADVVRSAQHPIVKEARRLDADAAARRRERKGIAWGRHLALEALDAAVPIDVALLSPDLEKDDEGSRIAAAIARTKARVVRVTPSVLEGIAAGAGDQGIALVVRRPATAIEDLLKPRPTLLLLAHGIQDPGNLGSILRSSRSLGAEGVAVLEGSADPWSSRALRAAMGATFRLPVVESTTSHLLPLLEQAGLRLVAAVSTEGTTPDRIDLKSPVALLLGREGSGLPKELIEAAHDRVRIPMSPGADSLNVHAAAAILLYETRRQRTPA